MDLQTLVLEPARPAVASIVMLHGLGADGTDFLPLADELDLSALGPVRWVLPRAPVRPVTINNGYRMRAWYDILATDLARREDEAGLRASAAQVLELLDREVAHGMPA
ncbi:MAG TPA: carboxylesterase, partial [Rubrivivax sp.]|nr:carboxylesterase [Rubrivivax sp.]